MDDASKSPSFVFTEFQLSSHSVFTVRRNAWRGDATLSCPSVRPSVCLSVTFRYVFHIGWNTSKIISRLIRLRFLYWLIPTSAIWSNGKAPRFWWMSLWAENLQYLWGSRIRHTRFQLVLKSMTLDDLERPIHTLAEKMRFAKPVKLNLQVEIWIKIDPYNHRGKCRPLILQFL